MQATIRVREEALAIVRSSLQMKRSALENGLRQYQARARSFEQHHRMTSADFRERFSAGDLGDNEEWFEWEFVLDAEREARRQLELLDSVEL